MTDRNLCSACGNPVAGDWEFCQTCGEPVAAADSSSSGSDVSPTSRPRIPIVAAIVATVVVAVVSGLMGVRSILDGGDTSSPEAVATETSLDAQSFDTTQPDTSGTTSETSPTDETTSTSTTIPPTTTAIPERDLLLVSATASATAPEGVDSQGNPVSYEPSTTIDGDPATAWRVAGDGVGESIRVQLADTSLVTRVGLIPGYAKVDPYDGTDRFTQNRTVRVARWTFDDGSQVLQEFEASPEVQYIDVPQTQTEHVVVEVVATSEPGGRDFTAISEIVVFGRPGGEGETTGEPQPLVHLFPLDPSDAGTYSEGGHSYPATDIFAPLGTNFVAVTSGVIEEVSRVDGWDPDIDDGATRGGLFVSLIGDDGVRYYGSHLSAVADGIEAGVRVNPGQLLGLVGRSGNARDTPSHLHFGISRPTFPGDWMVRRGEVAPVPYLDAWRAGEAELTPELNR